MSFSNTQLAKNMSSQSFLWHHKSAKIIKMSFLNTQLTKKTWHHVLYSLLIYMTPFATITPEEYKKLVDNEKNIRFN